MQCKETIQYSHVLSCDKNRNRYFMKNSFLLYCIHVFLLLQELNTYSNFLVLFPNLSLFGVAYLEVGPYYRKQGDDYEYAFLFL